MGCQFKYDHSFTHVKEMWIFDAFEQLFIEKVQASELEVKIKGANRIGSTDAGNVSQVVPTIHSTLKIREGNITIHTEEFKEASKSLSGAQAIIDGAEFLARIAIRLLADSSLLEKIKVELMKKNECLLNLSEYNEEDIQRRENYGNDC